MGGATQTVRVNKEQAVKSRPDLLSPQSPDGIEVFQMTSDNSLPSCHVYMEAQIVTPDSKRLLVHYCAHPHGPLKSHPKHAYLVCDLDDGELYPITDHPAATSPSLSPDGKQVYYFVDETRLGGGSLTLRCVNLDGTERQTVMVIDKPLPGGFRPSRIYPLSTISSDGKRLALPAFLGNGLPCR